MNSVFILFFCALSVSVYVVAGHPVQEYDDEMEMLKRYFDPIRFGMRPFSGGRKREAGETEKRAYFDPILYGKRYFDPILYGHRHA